MFTSKQLLLQSQKQTSLLRLVRACYRSTFFPAHLDNFIPCRRTRIDCLQLYSPRFLSQKIWKAQRHKDARRHLYFTPKLQTFSSLQHLLAYGWDYYNQPKISNLLLPGVELNACASIDIMSPLSPCTNRVSNALTVCATQTQCSEWQDKNTASAPAYSSTPQHEHLCACSKHSIFYSLHLIKEILALHR